MVQNPHYKSPPVDIILNYAKSNVSGTVAMDVTVLLEATPCILADIYLFCRRKFLLMYPTMKLGASRLFRKAGNYLPVYKLSHLKRPYSLSSS
jgi:hypothetical protein